MKLKLCLRLALKNLKANRLLNIAFVISVSIMLAILQIYANINLSDYVKKYSSFTLLSFYGLFTIGLFSFIFILYANSTIMKARSKELALYGILGLEKKHIMLIVILESLLSAMAIIALAGTLSVLLGKLLFLTVGKMLLDASINLRDYHYYPAVFLQFLMFIAFCFTVVILYNFKTIKNTLPINLLNQSKIAEKEPKSRWFLAILGLLLLFLGYTIALSVKGNLQSLGMFFVAALLVMMATYYLFVALSIICLKILRYNKPYYYQKVNFIFISGMMQRMKSNAMGLASITILITGIIISMSTALSIYQSIEDTVNTRINRDYQIIVNVNDGFSEDLATAKNQLKQLVIQATGEEQGIENDILSPIVFLPAFKVENQIVNHKVENAIDFYLDISTIDHYNAIHHSNLQLNNHQVLLASNSSLLDVPTEIRFGEEVFQVLPSDLVVPNYMALETYSLVVANYQQLTAFSQYFSGESQSLRAGVKQFVHSNEIQYNYSFDLKNKDKDYLEILRQAVKPIKGNVDSRNDIKKFTIATTGGILFTGIVVSLLFLIGAILIIYYKQITEAYQDKERITIMQKVGLEKQLIKKTGNKQILWLFFTPLVIALIHAFVASKIVFQLLAIFGIHQYQTYAGNMLLVTGIISFAYFIIFKITANIYYRIVTD